MIFLIEERVYIYSTFQHSPFDSHGCFQIRIRHHKAPQHLLESGKAYSFCYLQRDPINPVDILRCQLVTVVRRFGRCLRMGRSVFLIFIISFAQSQSVLPFALFSLIASSLLASQPSESLDHSSSWWWTSFQTSVGRKKNLVWILLVV